MAYYDRKILVPYLMDVCTAEMLNSKLQKEISNYKVEIKKQESYVSQKIVYPEKPDPSSFESGRASSNAIAAIVLPIVYLLIGAVISLFAESLFPIIIGAVIGGCVWLSMSDDAEKLRRKENEQYQNALNRYNATINRIERYKKSLPSAREKLSHMKNHLITLQNRYSEVMDLRNEIYSVNIIPTQYRNIYSAYYLYDYFKTSRETDLDKIIQTLLLEEIKQRLDKIIAQNEEILLNQRVQLALQEYSNKLIADNHREQMLSIAQMERNQELQIDYQQMIAKTQIMTNFLIAADYLHRN